MPGCAVFGCNNRNTNTKEKNVKFYTFPKINDLAQQWLHACSRNDKVNLKNATVCSLHFTEECFFTPLKHQMLQYTPKRYRNLKPDAIPTLNLPKSKDPVEYSARCQRRQLKERRSLVEEAMGTVMRQSEQSEGVCGSVTETGISMPNGGNEHTDGTITMDKWLEMENKLKLLEEENKTLAKKVIQLEKHTEDLESEKASLYTQLKSVNKATEVEPAVAKILSRIFSPGQIRLLLNRKKKIHWNSEDISCAISLRSVSAKAYRYLRNKLKYPLPALSSIRRWVSRFECAPGVLKEVLLVMEKNGRNLSEIEKLTVLSFDEMSLSRQICFERKEEKIFGPHEHAQVVMARGLTAKWKQPVYYDFDKPMKKATLFEIIRLLGKAGFTVVSVTSDLGGENRSMWKELNISYSQNWFTIPNDLSRKIFVFADIPHLLKLARNHFVQKGFVVCGNEHVTKACLERIHSMQKTDLKIAFKLSNEHLYVESRKKQNVKLAAQLFSNSNANAIRFYGEKGLLFGNWKVTADIIQLFNDWFDVFNSSVPYTPNKVQCGFGLNLELQQKIVENMTAFIQDSVVFGHKKLLPFQLGIILSNKSLLDLQVYLSKFYNTKYILTAKLNQDVLENFFSCIRGMGRTHDHPDALQFMYRIRWYVMGRHSTTMMAVKSNILPDSEECLTASSCSTSKLTQNITETEECCTAKLLRPFLDVSSFEPEHDENDSVNVCSSIPIFSENNDDPLNKMKDESLRYVTGYVAFKLQNKYPDLGGKTNDVSETVDEYMWVETVSNGGLRIPSRDFFMCAKIIEDSFVQFHGQNDICKNNGVLRKVKTIAEEKIRHFNIPDEAITRLILVLTYIRIRHLNKRISRKDENQIKWSKKLDKFHK